MGFDWDEIEKRTGKAWVEHTKRLLRDGVQLSGVVRDLQTSRPVEPESEAEADRPLADRLALYQSWAAAQQRPGLVRLLDELRGELAELRCGHEAAIAKALNEQAKSWCRLAEHGSGPPLEAVLALVPAGPTLACFDVEGEQLAVWTGASKAPAPCWQGTGSTRAEAILAAVQAYLDAGGEPARLSSQPVALRPVEPTLEQLLELVPPGWELTSARDYVGPKVWASFRNLGFAGQICEGEDLSWGAAQRAAVLAWLRAQPPSRRPCQSCQHWDRRAEPSAGGARPCLADSERRWKHPAASCPEHYTPRGETIADTEPAPLPEPRERVVQAAMAWAADTLKDHSVMLRTERDLLEAVDELRAGEGGES